MLHLHLAHPLTSSIRQFAKVLIRDLGSSPFSYHSLHRRQSPGTLALAASLLLPTPYGPMGMLSITAANDSNRTSQAHKLWPRRVLHPAIFFLLLLTGPASHSSPFV